MPEFAAASPQTEAAARWARPLWLLLAVELAVLIVYAGALDGDFVLDARALIADNPFVREASWENAAVLLTSDYWHPHARGGLYRPATTLSFLVQHAPSGEAIRPLPFHLVNLALHLGAVGLVFTLARRSLASDWAAVAAAGLFGLHPLASEAVAYIGGRADLLSAVGVLGALAVHGSTRGGTGGAALFTLCSAVAAFSKETGLVLPLLLLAHDALLPARPGRGGRYLLAATILVAHALARAGALGSLLETPQPHALDNPLVAASPLAARLTALVVGVRALGLMLWPATLSSDYSCCEITPIPWPPDGGALLRLGFAVAVFAGLLWWIARQRRRHPARCLFALLALIAWLPASNLAVLSGTVLAERTLYLPLAGVAVVAASFFEGARAHGGGRVAAAVLVVVLSAYALRTWQRTHDWHDEVSLWASAVAAVPGSAKAHAGLAAALFAAPDAGERLDMIVALGERAVAIYPDYPQALVALGGHAVRAGDARAGTDPGAAESAYARAVAALERARDLEAEEQISPADRNLHNNLSLAYLRAGRLDEALRAYERSRNLEPLVARRHADVAAVLARLGRSDEAATALFTAILLDPADTELQSWLLELYGSPAPGESANGDGGLGIDFDDARVRGPRCRALDAVVTIHERAGHTEAAAFHRSEVARQCPP